MRNNDAFKLLYNNLWLSKTELPKFIKDSKNFIAHEGSNILNNSTENSLTLSSLANREELKTKKDNVKVANEIQLVNNITPELIPSWERLTDTINNCTICNLCHTRKNVVIERGERNSKWMFIGEAPGENEDIQGKPFVGAAGELLDKMILAMKLNSEKDVYICNAVKCRPPKNRNPEEIEIKSCNNYLLSQINLVKPKLIITLGRIAAHTLLKTTDATARLRGKVHYSENNVPVIVTYHPAYLLRNPSAKKDSWEDLQFALKTFTNL